MKKVTKTLAVCAMALYAGLSLANFAPSLGIAHNKTADMEANAFLGGTQPSPMPIAANSTLQVPWFLLMLGCSGHTDNNWCSALIKIGTNTSNPISMGDMKINLQTGEILPKEIHNSGYSIYVNGSGEVTLVKD